MSGPYLLSRHNARPGSIGTSGGVPEACRKRFKPVTAPQDRSNSETVAKDRMRDEADVEYGGA